MKREYYVVRNSGATGTQMTQDEMWLDFSLEIDKYLADKYQLVGGVSITMGDNRMYVAQAMMLEWAG